MVKTGTSKLSSPATNPYSSPTGKAHRVPLSPTKSPQIPTKKNILTVTNILSTDGSPWGWMYANSYDIKEQLKALCNKLGEHTFIGSLEFKAYTNLSLKWIRESQFGNNLWVVRIDEADSNSEFSFPMSAHKAYSNKFVRAIIAQNIKTLGTIEVSTDLILTESNMDVMNSMFGDIANIGDGVREALLEEFIAEANDDLEQLI